MFDFQPKAFPLAIDIDGAARRVGEVLQKTSLEFNHALSQKYHCQVYLKREDRQVVRSYKIRGAYNIISSLSDADRTRGVICASAGNHAQGVAYTCKKLGIHGTIFMPANTPAQKINRVKKHGGDAIKIFLEGETYDACYAAACSYNVSHAKVFIHPFDDEAVIAGQGTVAKEITEELKAIDFLFVPVGGGGLAAGCCSWLLQKGLATCIVGVEPAGAASMTRAFDQDKPVALDSINPFVDGAAVTKVGALTYAICRERLDKIVTVTEGKVCSVLLQLYNEEAIVAEPAGVLSVAALDQFAEDIRGKTVVCVISGGNNDVLRFEEIRKLADAYEGLHHHLMIRFRHQPDGLLQLMGLLSTNDYITRLDYMRREHGRSTYGLVGIKFGGRESYVAFIESLRVNGIEYREVEQQDFLFTLFQSLNALKYSGFFITMKN